MKTTDFTERENSVIWGMCDITETTETIQHFKQLTATKNPREKYGPTRKKDYTEDTDSLASVFPQNAQITLSVEEKQNPVAP